MDEYIEMRFAGEAREVKRIIVRSATDTSVDKLKNGFLFLQNHNNTQQLCVNASFNLFTGVVECLFLVVKSCVLAAEN